MAGSACGFDAGLSVCLVLSCRWGWLLIEVVAWASSCRTGIQGVLRGTPWRTPRAPGRSPRLWRGSLRYSENPGQKDSRLSPPATRLHARVVPAGQSSALPYRLPPLCCLFGWRPFGTSPFACMRTVATVGKAALCFFRLRPCRQPCGLIRIFFRSSAPSTGVREVRSVVRPPSELLRIASPSGMPPMDGG